MRILQLVLFSTVILFFTSCNNDSGGNNNESGKVIQKDFVKTFEGSVGDSEIRMKLFSDRGQLEGKYFYVDGDGELELSGILNSNGAVVLKEFDQNDNQTGQFEGSFINPNKVEGNWSKPNGNSSMNFDLIASNTSYEAYYEDFSRKKESRNKEKKSEDFIQNYSPDEIVGNWEIKMESTRSDCDNVNKGTKYVENWMISYVNNEVKVDVIDSSTKIKKYSGYLIGNKIVINNRITTLLGGTSKVKIELKQTDKDTFKGTRSVLNPGPCEIEYDLIAKKK